MNKKSTILTVLVIAGVAFVVYSLRGCPGPAAWLTSRIDSTYTQQPTPPPPSDSIPNAPGPDNTITTPPPPAAPETPAGSPSPANPSPPTPPLSNLSSSNPPTPTPGSP